MKQKVDRLRRFISKVASKKTARNSWIFHSQFHLLAVILVALPFVSVCWKFVENYHLLGEGEKRLTKLMEGAENTAILRKKRLSQLKQLAVADPLYLDKYLVKPGVLRKQREDLQTLTINEALKGCDTWNRQLETLTGDDNQILFQESETKSVKNIREALVCQTKPVQIGNEDLKRILSVVEGVRIGSYLPPAGRPNLLIKKFQLTRTQTISGGETFLLNIDLVKREGKE